MDGFKALRDLEAGVFGKVTLVQRSGGSNTFALKQVKCSNMSAANTLLRQAFLMRAYDHPNVVKYHDLSLEQRGSTILVSLLMDFYGEGSLSCVISQYSLRDPPSLTYLLSLAVQIANGMAFLHSKDLTHRDLKPQNILMSSNRKRAVVTDYGIPAPPQPGQEVPGTPAYMAPEQAEGRGTCMCDLWAIGCIILDLMMPGRPKKILYAEALRLGQVAFHADLQKSLGMPDRWPRALLDIVLSLLSVDPSDRPEAPDVYYQLRSLLCIHSPASVPLVITAAPEYEPRMKDCYGLRQNSGLLFEPPSCSKSTRRPSTLASHPLGLEALRALLESALPEEVESARQELPKLAPIPFPDALEDASTACDDFKNQPGIRPQGILDPLRRVAPPTLTYIPPPALDGNATRAASATSSPVVRANPATKAVRSNSYVESNAKPPSFRAVAATLTAPAVPTAQMGHSPHTITTSSSSPSTLPQAHVSRVIRSPTSSPLAVPSPQYPHLGTSSLRGPSSGLIYSHSTPTHTPLSATPTYWPGLSNHRYELPHAGSVPASPRFPEGLPIAAIGHAFEQKLPTTTYSSTGPAGSLTFVGSWPYPSTQPVLHAAASHTVGSMPAAVSWGRQPDVAGAYVSHDTSGHNSLFGSSSPSTHFSFSNNAVPTFPFTEYAPSTNAGTSQGMAFNYHIQ